MHTEQDCDTVYVGLVSLNSRALLSPEASHPELFTVPHTHEEHISNEVVARTHLGQRSIVASSLYALTPYDVPRSHTSCGYLLRESRVIDLSSQGLAAFTSSEIRDYIETNPTDRQVQLHFLKQILQYLK